MFLLSAEYSVIMCWVCPGTLVTWPWLRLGMKYCWALRLWSQICVTCRSCWFPYLVTLSCALAACLELEGLLQKYEMDTEHFDNQNLRVVVVMVRCARQNFYVFSLYRNAGPDNRIFSCLPTSIISSRACWGCTCLIPVCGWFDWPSSGILRIYEHEWSSCCRLWPRKCVYLVATSWLPALLMHKVGHFISWPKFLT